MLPLLGRAAQDALREEERRAAEAERQAERRVAEAERHLATVRRSAAEAVRRAQQRLERPRQRAADGARAFAELQAEQRRGQFQESWRALEALVPGGGADDVAQLTTVSPDFDGTEAAPLAALQLAVRTWRAVGVLRAQAAQHPDSFAAFTAA